jgi:hypothetical protein
LSHTSPSAPHTLQCQTMRQNVGAASTERAAYDTD